MNSKATWLAAFPLLACVAESSPPPARPVSPEPDRPAPSLLIAAPAETGLDSGSVTSPPPPEVFSYGLGPPDKSCSVDRMLARLGRCKRISGRSEQAALSDGNACTGAAIRAGEDAAVHFGGKRTLSGVIVIAGGVEQPNALRLLELQLREGEWSTHTRLPSPQLAERAFAGVFVVEGKIDAYALRARTPEAATEWLEIAPFICADGVKSPDAENHLTH